ncbi:hypothetical protein EDB19DRAFT_1833160 [Suillus lakei]|nr:hypothetical protein EDB19DRAFT_1833160 [Suillus lakei]
MEILTRVTDEVCDSLDSATSRLAEMAEQSQQVAAEALRDRQTHKQQLDSTQMGSTQTYAKALQSNCVKPASNLSEAALVKRASQALITLHEKGFNVPENTDFTSVRKLPHGGALFEVNAVETKLCMDQHPAQWDSLCPRICNTTIKERTFQIIAEYVPTSFEPESSLALKEMEKCSRLNSNAIVRAKWLKPINRCNPSQRTGFCIIACVTREDTNKAIKQGLTIKGRKVSSRKLLPEPTCCLKCQQLTNAHITSNCPSKEDVCGMCAKNHRTSKCTITSSETEQQCCKNCDQAGHAAWSRDCPKYTERIAKLLEWIEEAQYKYFPVEDDPDSWEVLGGPCQQPPPHTFTRYEQPAASGTDFGTQPSSAECNQWTRVDRGKKKHPKVEPLHKSEPETTDGPPPTTPRPLDVPHPTIAEGPQWLVREQESRR